MARRITPEQSASVASAAPVNARDAYKDVPILQPLTWNNDIAIYFFLGGVSSGAFVLGTLLDAAGTKERRLARAAKFVSFGTMLLCPPFLIHDLGRRTRFHHMLRIFKPSSPMNLGSWTLTAHGLFATLVAMRQLAKAGKLPLIDPMVRAIPEQLLTIGGVSTALTLGGYTGVLIGTTSIPVWSTSPVLGGRFMASARSAGAAATVLAAALTGEDDPRGQATVTPFRIAAGCVEIALLGGYLVTSGEAARPLLKGRELLLLGAIIGTVTVLILELIGTRASADRQHSRPTHPTRASDVAGAVLTLIGGACLRWSIVRAGHVSAADREGTIAATKPSKNAPGWGQRDREPRRREGAKESKDHTYFS